jgi:hypothetical protein
MQKTINNKPIVKENVKKNNIVKRFSTGVVSVTIFDNEALNNEGEIVSFNSINLSKAFLDKNTNTWKHTSSLNRNDVPNALLCLFKAYEFLQLKNNETEEDKVYYPVED